MSGTQDGFDDFFDAQNELHALFNRALEGMLSEQGITVAQAFTLRALKDQEGPCRMTDLAASRLHTPAAMTGIVDRLIQMDLVERRSDPNDRRVILLCLTARGAVMVSGFEKKVQGMMRRFFDSIPEADREATMRIFNRLKDYLRKEPNARK